MVMPVYKPTCICIERIMKHQDNDDWDKVEIITDAMDDENRWWYLYRQGFEHLGQIAIIKLYITVYAVSLC